MTRSFFQRSRMLLAALLASVAAAPLANAADTKTKRSADKAEKIDVTNVSLEIEVLSTLRRLDASDDQIKLLRGLSKETSQPVRARKPTKVSAKYSQLLTKLRDTFLAADDSKIDDLIEKLEELKDSEEPELDDEVEITDAARRRAAEVLKQLSALQIVTYMIQMDVQEPLDLLQEAIHDSQTTTGEEWMMLRNDYASHITWLTVGADLEKTKTVREQVNILLNKAHNLKPADFKKTREELDQAAKKIVGEQEPFTLLRHTMEFYIADLLSNPRLEAVTTARLKKSTE